MSAPCKTTVMKRGRNFRGDLDYATQTIDVQNHHAFALHEVAMRDWKNTCQTKTNHKVMLRILIGESFRFKYGATLSKEQSLERATLLHKVEDLMMGESDNYAQALSVIGRYRYFA